MNRTLKNQQRRGVTLIETIMVITLLAAAAATGSILFDGQWVASRGVTAVTNDVANTLITARNTAITNQATVRVRRQRRSGIERLLVTQDPGPMRDGNSWTVELGREPRLRGGPREIRFTPTGTANRNLAWTITQSRTSGRVNVAPASGQVTRRLP
jgi:prepilin-type N-terminal cleavage/methylation domain-containing protein